MDQKRRDIKSLLNSNSYICASIYAPMGNHKRITIDSFPEQKQVSELEVTINNEVLKATPVRADAEDPNVVIYRTADNHYLLEEEISDGFELPEQGTHLGKRANVIFHYDTSNKIRGTIVRDDNAEPYQGIIHLDNDRVIKTTECQYSTS